MGTKRTDEFRADAVQFALASGLTLCIGLEKPGRIRTESGLNEHLGRHINGTGPMVNPTTDEHKSALDESNYGEMSVASLVDLLLEYEDVDQAIGIEQEICRNITEDSVREIEKLFASTNRYCNIAALRVLSDSGRVGLSNIFDCLDRFLDGDDVVLKRISVRLIQQHGFFHTATNRRMVEFAYDPDKPIRDAVRVWLLRRSLDELEEFSSLYCPFKDDLSTLIDLIVSFKSKAMSVDEFLSGVSAIDDLAFQEYERLSKVNTKYARALFHDR